MIFQLFEWHFDINLYKFEKRLADVFQIYPIAIHFNPPQFCPSLSLFSFPVFCLSSSIVLSRYFVISVNSMTTLSMLKLLKIAWPSPFKLLLWAWNSESFVITSSRRSLNSCLYRSTRNKVNEMFCRETSTKMCLSDTYRHIWYILLFCTLGFGLVSSTVRQILCSTFSWPSLWIT